MDKISDNSCWIVVSNLNTETLEFWKECAGGTTGLINRAKELLIEEYGLPKAFSIRLAGGFMSTGSFKESDLVLEVGRVQKGETLSIKRVQ